MNNSQLLATAGEAITAATQNTTSSIRRHYLATARESLLKIDKEKLKPNQKGIVSMLQQKIQAIDPVSVPQFSGLGDYVITDSSTSSPLIALLIFLAVIWLIKRMR